MRESLKEIMMEAVRTFKSCAQNPQQGGDCETAGWLSDNYYILERRARQSAAECARAQKIMKGSDLLPGLFARCLKLCEGGMLPNEEKIIEFLSEEGLSAAAAECLPSAITCALVDKAAKGAEMHSGAGAKQIANAVSSLRRMAELDFDLITESLCEAEAFLLDDSAGIYPQMDRESKSFYRRRIAALSQTKSKTEARIAREAAEKAKSKGGHIGEYLFSGGRNTRNGRVFLIMEFVMPLAVSFAAAAFFAKTIIGILLFFPLWELLRHPIERASMQNVTPIRFPRLKTDSDSVMNADALITVSTLLPAPNKIGKLEEHLERLYLSNCFGNIKICCLADFKGAGMPSKPGDKPMLKVAKESIDRLNRKYGGGFLLAVRPRVYSETQGEFIGRERKRGAITELIRAIKGNTKGFSVFYGDTKRITQVKYLIALDADTRLAFDSARELISIAEHPLNKPIIRGGRVVSGYGLLVPRTENRLEGENTSVFAAIMAGESGFAAYDSLAGERYQDLFGEGIFSGKGLICVDAYYSLLDKGLPSETILSHDIIESGYLRAGFVPDVQITEGFPQRADSYFSRLQRWVRGDWQNIKFIFGKNPLNALSRYKMLDNLRRSLTSALCLAAILASALIQGNAGVITAVISMLAISAGNLYSGVNSLFNGGFSALSRLYYSKTLPAALNSFARAFLSLVFSVKESVACITAAVKAMWRLFVSGKNLLEWTTAAQSEGQRGIPGMLASGIPSVLVSGALLAVGLPIHRLIGIIILLEIPLTILSGTKVKSRSVKISEKHRDAVLSYAGAAWGFFDEQCGRDNNFLPPDNIQLAPARTIARRTSPTNIGLMLTSFLAARDLGFITTAELLMRLNLSLGTIEKLEKYKGNLLNWYSTQTLEPLAPRFVSTVDSGNFLCCLTALKEGLREYLPECGGSESIIDRIEKIIDETDLGALYNERRELFHIGIYPDDARKSESYYDLFMSEARMTAYFAVARRLVPKKHWGSMGRILVGQGRYTGLASWTGTMFEYFMPNLFIPAPVGSISNESQYFCLQCQRKRAGRRPFGISESGFYAFDGDLNYQYKAHGVQRLGLKRGLDSETVISPYSSFLTLTSAPEASIKNLSRLAAMGMTGKYGFYEAADFTRGRNSGDFSVVRSYMAHHVGMSLLAADNFLRRQCMQKRFMRDGSMRGADSLLEERIPTGATVFTDIKAHEIPRIRERVQSKNTLSQSPCVLSPKATLFSNGRLTMCITDVGTGVSIFDGVDITTASEDLLARPEGIFGVFSSEKEKIPFVKALDTVGSAKYSAEFFKDKAEFRAQKSGIKLKMRAKITKQKNCEIREFLIENTSKKDTLTGALTVYFNPCLEKRAAYAAHPAFSKLFLIDDWDADNECLIFSRRARDSAVPCAVAAGFLRKCGARHESSRERVLKTPDGVFSIGEKTDFAGHRGNPDSCCAFSVDIELKPREKTAYSFAVAVEETKEQALETLMTVRASGQKKAGENPFYADSLENAVAGGILPAILHPKNGMKASELNQKCNFGKEELWSFGVSGDIPIILLKIDEEEDVPAVLPYIRLNKVLRSCGIATDLVVSCRRENGYSSAIASQVRKILQAEDCGLMLGVRGGVHLTETTAHTYEQQCALESIAVFIGGAAQNPTFPAQKRWKPLKMMHEFPSKSGNKKENTVKQYNFTEREISIDKNPAIVDIPWTIVLSNRCFGTMVSDKSLGFTWAINSRENKLTPWYNDTMSDNRGEMLILKYNGVLYDIAAIGRAEFTPNKAVWSAKIEGMIFKATVTVDDRALLKKCTVEIENISQGVRNFDLMYYTLPVLGVNPESRGAIFASRADNGAVIESSNADIPGFFALTTDATADYVCFSRGDFFEGRFEQNEQVISADCCAAIGRKISLAVGGEISVDFFLSWGASESAALKMPQVASNGSKSIEPDPISSGDKKLDLFFNSFLYSQIKKSRFFGRTGFYQCSGAYGFRDQLQDSLAFLETEPLITRTHIIRCAAVQFEKGDVLHWWHVLVDKTQKIRGIRSKCSDDMLWLPYVCFKYFDSTGDESIFSVNAPYLEDVKLEPGERERYCAPTRTAYKESILNHCLRAIDYSLKFGKNSLPLIGSCDWNDGFSRVGDDESGESVWLAMFQKIVLEQAAKICRRCGMEQKADEYIDIASKTAQAVESAAWRGDRYIRAITKSGEPLGGDDFIDILPQAFAVFAEIGDLQSREKALETAYNKLFDEKSGVVRLLSPAFDEDAAEDVGYIASYPAGIRENSGQYTHAAVWLAAAMLQSGKIEQGVRLLSAINPLSFYEETKKAMRYRAEPYVLAGDVSYGDEISGRAGWTHFTGSAAWFYRSVMDNLPAIKRYFHETGDGNKYKANSLYECEVPHKNEAGK